MCVEIISYKKFKLFRYKLNRMLLCTSKHSDSRTLKKIHEQFCSFCLKYRINMSYDRLGLTTKWKVLAEALKKDLKITKADQLALNVLWSNHQMRKQGNKQ